MKRAWNPHTADWLVAQRGDVDQDEIVERLAKLPDVGRKISRSWLSRIENGQPFSDDLLRAFETMYGSVPPPYEPPDTTPPIADQAALIEALTAQTQAMTALAVAMQDSLAGVRRGLKAAARLQRAASSTAPSPPRPRAGAQ